MCRSVHTQLLSLFPGSPCHPCAMLGCHRMGPGLPPTLLNQALFTMDCHRVYTFSTEESVSEAGSMMSPEYRLG